MSYQCPFVILAFLFLFFIPLPTHAQRDDESIKNEILAHVQKDDDFTIRDEILSDLNIASTGRGMSHDDERAIYVIEKIVTSQQQKISKLTHQLAAQEEEIAELKSDGRSSEGQSSHNSKSP
jgi:hypothetical protein